MRYVTENDIMLAQTADPYTGETRQEYISRVEKEGRAIVMPGSNELFIDIDSEEDYDRFQAGLSTLQTEHPKVIVTRESPSKEGHPHCHIVVSMPFELSFLHRIAYQAALGSDNTREILSIFRAEKGDPWPTLFAEDLSGEVDGSFE